MTFRRLDNYDGNKAYLGEERVGVFVASDGRQYAVNLNRDVEVLRILKEIEGLDAVIAVELRDPRKVKPIVREYIDSLIE